jgi:hypothetical protein
MEKGLTEKEVEWGLNELRKLNLVDYSEEKGYKFKEGVDEKFTRALEYFYKKYTKEENKEKRFDSVLTQALVLLVVKRIYS